MDFTMNTCREFVAVLASNEPVPGGGGAAALVGAIGTALGNMVGSLTVGKKKYADVEAEIIALKQKSDALQKELLDQVPADAEYFYWDFRSVKTAGATISLANLQLIYDDIGGMQGKYSTISGNVYGGYEIGDANADKDFNICDIVRANNYVTATGAKPEIYFSAANVAERDQGILDDNDTTELIKMLLNKAE